LISLLPAIEYRIVTIMKSPIEQCKEHILKYLNIAISERKKEVWIRSSQIDYKDYLEASKLPDIKECAEKNGIKLKVVLCDKDGIPVPDIFIATIEDVANGKFHEYLKSRGLTQEVMNLDLNFEIKP
jgi:hypothetical protein